jgi:xanthine dehydrogenase YagS FAD-binding subunit
LLYEIPKLKHVGPTTVEEVTHWLSQYGEKAKILAGGTDLLGLIKDEVTGPKFPSIEVLVSVNNVSRMKGISHSESEGLRVGAAMTLSELSESREVRDFYPAISQAASEVATPQIRNAGTLGGNLCQRPWCWYFRHPLFPCYKKGGKQCYAITGEHRFYFSAAGLGTCVMGHPSDLAPALVSLGASVTICGPDGERTIPIDQFFNGPKEVMDNVLKPNEVLVEAKVGTDFRGPHSSYVKYRMRDTWDLAMASTAVALKMDGERCADARVVLGGVAPYPYRCNGVEKALVDTRLDEGTVSKAAEEFKKSAKPLPMTKYKVKLTTSIIKRAVVAAR